MAGEYSINSILNKMVEKSASDCYITLGCPVSFRINDQLHLNNQRRLAHEDIVSLLKQILSEGQKKELYSDLELNFSRSFGEKARFRFNCFFQQGTPGMVVRRVMMEIPTIEDLGLPSIYKDVVMQNKGLVVLASPSGSGKSTSLAAMVGHRNHRREGHILTVEDPIEFVHDHRRSIITQREVGADTSSYHMALKNALRQKADVIVVGEIRDHEAMDHAIKFAETGHLCITTLHASNADQAIDRIVRFFPEEYRKHVLLSLAQNLVAVFSQKLVATVTGDRVVAVEIMLNQGAIKNLIMYDKLDDIHIMMEKNRPMGMQTMDEALVDLYFAGRITEEVAIAEATNPSNIRLKISQKKELK